MVGQQKKFHLLFNGQPLVNYKYENTVSKVNTSCKLATHISIWNIKTYKCKLKISS